MNNNFDFSNALSGARHTSLRVFPNPADTDLYLEGVDNLKTASLLNMDGKSVLISNNIHISGLSKIPAGIYILKVETDDKILAYQKVVLKH
jgi:hypothetical protein